jgi:hypothetical protein
MIEYKESFLRIDVYYNGKHIGCIEREAGFTYYFMYYLDENISSEMLELNINDSKKKFENVIRSWEKLILNK